MSESTLIIVLIVPMVLALAFGIWAGLGYPGLFALDARTGKASREMPWKRLAKGGRFPLTSEVRREKKEEEEQEAEPDSSSHLRPDFTRGRRFSG